MDSVPRRFENRVALVVGGAQGIGKAIAVRLAREGARVVIADIDCPMMQSTVCEMQAERCDVQGILCDVRSGEQVRSMVGQVIDGYGRIEVLMQVAGIASAVPFLNMPDDVWDDTVDTNLRGAYVVARSVAPHMVARREGKIVFVASTNCWDAEAQLAHYNASKAGMFLLAKTLARELGPYHINSNAVGPGFIRTRLTEPLIRDERFMKKYSGADGVIPLQRLGLPEDVAGPALFLASSDADYVNGVLLFVDGGQLA